MYAICSVSCYGADVQVLSALRKSFRMGALPNATVLGNPSTSSSKRKAPARADRPAVQKCAARTRKELHDSFRAGSDYSKGWAPLYRCQVSDTVSLATGMVFVLVRDYLVGLAYRTRQRGDGIISGSTEVEISISETATFLDVSARAINRELAYMDRRKLAIVKRLERGRAVVRLMFAPEKIGSTEYPGWSEVAKVDYRAWRKANPDWDAAEDGTATEGEQEAKEEAAPDLTIKPGTVEITRKPVAVRGGHRSRAIPLNCGVKSLRVDWTDNKLDLSFSAVVTSGELILTGKLPDQKAVESNKVANRADSTSSKRPSGTTVPRNAPIPPNAGIIPRGEELAKLFDPVLLDKLGKSLSADLATLKHAAEIIAAAKVSPEYLASQVEERAKRKISSVPHVVRICQEIAANWPKVKDRPAPPHIPTREELDELVRRDKEARLKKQAELRRK